MVAQLCDSRVEEERAVEKMRLLIYFRDRLFKYPFSFTNALKHLGPIDTLLVSLSYLETWLGRQLAATDNDDFEDAESWLKNRFGVHLYNIFFASYFHKLWGRPARQLHADCAIETIQRIFRGGLWLQPVIDASNDQVVSGLPLATLVRQLDPPAPTNVMAAADCLRYRSLIVVVLMIEHDPLFFEHEIYVHSPAVQVSSIQNFKAWTLMQVADCQKICLGMTYLCDAGDSLWTLGDDELVQLASRELLLLKLTSETTSESDLSLIESAAVVRYSDVYPVRCVGDYQHEAVVQRYLERFENLAAGDFHNVGHSTHQDGSLLNGVIAASKMTRVPFAQAPSCQH